MNRTTYYENLKELARNVRMEFKFAGPRILKSDLRRVLKAQGIQIDYWTSKLKKVRGAYFFDDECGPSVLIKKGMPDEPTIFTMAHELKHHLTDKDKPLSYCSETNYDDPVEIGAEIFAAELIYPEQDFADDLQKYDFKTGECPPEILVRLKNDTKTTLSHTSLAKRCEFMQFAQKDAFKNVKWIKLQESIFGVPFYKRRSQIKKRFRKIYS